jgi:hypothetical protein
MPLAAPVTSATLPVRLLFNIDISISQIDCDGSKFRAHALHSTPVEIVEYNFAKAPA